MKVTKDDGTEVKQGEILEDFRGEKWVFDYLTRDHKIYVKPLDGGMDRVFFPSVFNLKIEEDG